MAVIFSLFSRVFKVTEGKAYYWVKGPTRGHTTPRIKNLGCTSRAGHAPWRNVWGYGCIGKHDMNECVDA